MWVGRPGAATREQCDALRRARDAGVAHLEQIARQVSGGDAALEQRSLSYLRDNLNYRLGEPEQAGLRKFHELAADVGLVPNASPLTFF